MTGRLRPKRPAPLSLRLTSCERRSLEKLAGDQPLGRFIKERVFADAPASRPAEIVDRFELLARLLAALGESEVFANLDRIAKAVEAGNLELSHQERQQIALACLLVLEMRDDLIRALGLKPPSRSEKGQRR
ncbi:MAG: hypothetical protein JJ926_12870 [Roseitalea sp.]|nr:hypothetical protein [Roseitalea sp.]MBO6952770.1 hypothetical protein [Rhizobiaceae bacterium]MBO6592743.1 hypothetical protein [Roseitalea sp.]MBO6600514.1 hypothetical protein [Roseitalea sp.]MBO6612944.1 hypothetical protein [Roseitalea sp.]